VKGRWFGRNFDWYLSVADERLIRVPAAPGRHASIGIVSADLMGGLLAGTGGASVVDLGQVLPYLTMDGVNDCGVGVCCNLVSGKDVGRTTGTHPGGERLPVILFVRRVLDEADSAAKAVEMAQTFDCFTAMDDDLHFLVADAGGSSYCIEFVSNRVVVVTNAMAMTNFHLSEHLRTGSYTAEASGIERYTRLTNDLTRVASERDMIAALTAANYSQMGLPGNERTWWSELNGDENSYAAEFPGSPDHFRYGDTETADPVANTNAFRARMKAFAADEQPAVAAAKACFARFGGRHPIENVWLTLHSTVYDLQAKTLSVRILEGDRLYRFALAEPPFARQTGVFVNGVSVGAVTNDVTDGWTYEALTRTLTLTKDAPYAVTGLTPARGIRLLGPGAKKLWTEKSASLFPEAVRKLFAREPEHYATVSAWAVRHGLTPEACAASSTVLLSAALGADGLVDPASVAGNAPADIEKISARLLNGLPLACLPEPNRKLLQQARKD